MLDTQTECLRHRLRVETAQAHEKIDGLFSTLDLTAPASLGRFLAAHLLGFDAIRRSLSNMTGRADANMLDDMTDCLSRDLSNLGVKSSTLPLEAVKVNAEAADHIILGSRLGTAVLRRRWLQAENARVRSASAYFSMPFDAQLWRDHCNILTGRCGRGADADLTVDGVNRLFGVFERAYHAVE